MKCLLDTDAIIHYCKGTNQDVIDQIHAALENEVELYVSVITLAEYYHGAYASRAREREFSILQNFIAFAAARTLTVNDIIAEKYGAIQGALQKEGRIGGLFDVLIAATCLVYNLTLITGNKKDFLKVKDLSLFGEKNH